MAFVYITGNSFGDTNSFLYEDFNDMIVVIFWMFFFLTRRKEFPSVTHCHIKNMDGINKFLFDFAYNLFSSYFCRRKTARAKKGLSHRTGKLVGYISHVRRLKKKFCFKDSLILTTDETSIWNDMVSSRTVNQAGTKDAPFKTTDTKKVQI